MKGITRSPARQPDPESDEGAGIEMLSSNSAPQDTESRDQSCDSKEGAQRLRAGDNRGKTLREKFRPFPWKTFFVISSLPFALAPIVTLATAAEEASVSYILGRDCYPNGLWKEANGATWRIMDSSYFFTPNLSFGSMTFTQVKVIDIAWDLLIGRGGQLLLAYVNYRVFNEWLLYHMEMHLTSYKMYTALSFETTSLSTLGVLAKEFLAFGKGTWRRFFRWLAMLSMLIGTFYVLAFPTLMAAMTGYITTYEAYVEELDGNLIEWQKVVPVKFIVEDADRIGNYSLPLVATENDVELVSAIADYLKRYPSTSDTETTFNFQNNPIDLPKPALNITISNNNSAAHPAISPGLAYEFYSLSPLNTSRQSNYYGAAYVHTHGSCKPSETYQWGFSYIFLFMVSIFNFVWSCIVVGMWFDTTQNSAMYKGGRRPGLLRSALDISRVMREELGRDVDHLEEEELRKRLTESGGALIVPKRELRVARVDSGGLEGELGKGGWRRRMTEGSTF